MAIPKIDENYHYVLNDPHKCKINLKNFILTSCAVLELLRKVSQGGGIRNPPRSDRVKVILLSALMSVR